MNKITDERLTELIIDVTGNLQRADKNLAPQLTPAAFAEVKQRFADVLSALNELQELRANTPPSQVSDGAQDAVTVRYDLSPAAHEGAIRNKLIEMGWAPPEAMRWPDAQITKVREVFVYPDPPATFLYPDRPETIKVGDSLCIDKKTGLVRRAGPNETSFATAAEDIVSREIELRPGGWAFNKADTGCGACNDGCPDEGCQVEKESPPVQQPVNAPCNHCGLRHDGLCDAWRNAQQAASVPESFRIVTVDDDIERVPNWPGCEEFLKKSDRVKFFTPLYMLPQQAASVPDGWKLVPVDTTKDWVKNMRETCAYTKGACEHLIRIVLAAAPEAPKP